MTYNISNKCIFVVFILPVTGNVSTTLRIKYVFMIILNLIIKENSQMKKYEYVNVEYKMKDMVMASISEHREIIEKYAKLGYRYTGMIPTEISANGCFRKIDLIFEKEE